MPLVPRAEVDMMRFAKFVDVMVNPVNTMGIAGAGLALAFRTRFPDWFEAYRTACLDDPPTFGIGQLHIYQPKDEKTTIISVATKRHWIDHSVPEDVEAGTAKLAEYLKEHPLYTVVTPLLGTGLGRMSRDEAHAMFQQYLEPLPNIIHLSMLPKDFAKIPQYLVVVGSRDYADYDRIDLGVGDALCEFGMTFADFDAMVSGGARGVDAVACGVGKPGDTTPTLAQSHGLKPIVCQADWTRFGNSAGFIRNRTMGDIGTHIVAFVGKNSVGTRMMVELVNRYNDHVDKLTAERQSPELNPDPFTSTPPPLPVKKQLYVINL